MEVSNNQITIDGSEDILDSRQIEERISYLEESMTCLNCGSATDESNTGHDDEDEAKACRTCRFLPTGHNADAGACPDYTPTCAEFVPYLDENEHAELKMLREFRDDVNSEEWRCGMAFIAESYFETYARETASDIHGQAVDVADWPFNCIDWKQAADELQMDYSTAELNETTYYYR